MPRHHDQFVQRIRWSVFFDLSVETVARIKIILIAGLVEFFQNKMIEDRLAGQLTRRIDLSALIKASVETSSEAILQVTAFLQVLAQLVVKYLLLLWDLIIES